VQVSEKERRFFRQRLVIFCLRVGIEQLPVQVSGRKAIDASVATVAFTRMLLFFGFLFCFLLGFDCVLLFYSWTVSPRK
jgi:hypothetical protein